VKGPRPLLTTNGASDFGTVYDAELLALGKADEPRELQLDQVRTGGCGGIFQGMDDRPEPGVCEGAGFAAHLRGS
jgi:hypothetical protein